MTLVLEVHPSDVNAAMLCPVRLVEDHPSEKRPSYDLVRGSIVHQMISFDLQGQPGADPMSLANFMFDDEFGMDIREFEFKPALIQLCREAEIAYKEWDTQVRTHLQWVSNDLTVEKEFKETIYVDEALDIEIDLVGTPDVVDGMGWIHDWKTARKMWEANKPPSQMQPPLYSFLVAGEPRPFIFWIFDYSTEKWEPMAPIIPTPFQVQAAVSTAIRVALARYHDTLIPNPGVPPLYAKTTRHWWCSPKYCHRWNNCSDRHLVNDGNDDVVADWTTEWREPDAS